MPSKNPKPPLSLRLPEDDEQWLRRAAAAAGEKPHAFLRRLVRDAREASERQEISR